MNAPCDMRSTNCIDWHTQKVEALWVAYQRSAQILIKGMVPIYQASDELREALAG